MAVIGPNGLRRNVENGIYEGVGRMASQDGHLGFLNRNGGFCITDGDTVLTDVRDGEIEIEYRKGGRSFMRRYEVRGLD